MASPITINTKFDKSTLPRWAQNDPNIVDLSESSLSFRIDVCEAKTSLRKAQLKREASTPRGKLSRVVERDQ